MRQHIHDYLPLSNIDDGSVDDESSIILVPNDDSLSINDDKQGNTVLEKFFQNVTVTENGWILSLLCSLHLL